MSTITELMKESFTGVGVFRDSFPVSRYFFDIHINEDGIAGYYVWRRNTYRFPILHPLLDMLMRRRRDSKTRDEVVEDDYRNFFIPYDEIQGLVTDRDHKEIQLLYSQEMIYFYYREPENYERFVEILKENVPEKYYTRDGIHVEQSINVS